MEAATGDGEHVARVQPTVGGTPVQDREAALRHAVSQGRWRHAVVLVQHGVTTPQRDATLLQAAESQQWDCILDVLCLGVSPEARDALFLKAAERQRWDCVSDVLDLGVSRPVRGDVFLTAVQQRWWDCVGKLFHLGVSTENLECGFSDIVDSGDARLTSDLITAGVSADLRDRVLRRALELGRVSFLVELLRLTPATSVSAFVLDMAVSLPNWTLVFETVKLHEQLQLSAQQMDAACTAAVSDRQWDCAFFLLERGVDPTQEMVDAVLRSGSDVLERFLGIYPREVMSSAVYKMVIEGAIELDSAHTLRDLLRGYGASEEETEEAFVCAVRCRSKEALQVLVSCANGNSQLLRQFCAAKTKDYLNENLMWICGALKDRHVALSFDIALATGNRSRILEIFLTLNETSWMVRRMLLRKVCAGNKLLFAVIAEKLAVKNPRYRRTLFLMAVRQGYHSIAMTVYGFGVSLRDVKYALSVSFANQAPENEMLDCEHSSKENMVLGVIKKLYSLNASRLLKGLVRKRLDSFVSRGEEEAEFLTWFKLYCEWEQATTRFVFKVFRQAYTAAVKWNRVKCFVGSITCALKCNRREITRLAKVYYARETFASNDKKTYYSDNETSKAFAAIDFALKKKKFHFVSKTILVLDNDNHELNTILLKRLFLNEAWPVLDRLFGSKFPAIIVRMCKYGKEFLHCLSRTVDNASLTGTALVEDPLAVGAVVVLDKWLQCMCPSSDSREKSGCKLARELRSDLRLGERSHGVLRLARLSSHHRCHSLALFLAVVVGADGEGLMERLMASHLPSVGANVIFELACYAIENLKKPAVAAVLIKNLPVSVLGSRHSYTGFATEELCPAGEARSEELTEALKRHNVPQWFFVCKLVEENFAEAEETLTLIYSQECVDVFVEHAARRFRWDLVCRYLSAACHPDLLQLTLTRALSYGSHIDASSMRRLVHLAGTAQSSRVSAPPYLYETVLFLSEPNWMAIHCLISLGASAQHRKTEGTVENRLCPLRQASRNKDLQLVKLFHRSGVCSNRRLFQLAADSHSAYFWHEEHEEVEPPAVHSYLTFAADCPLSLQDLCRHAVSSGLGGRPGYWRRVQALPVPQAVKAFVLFSDLLQEGSTVLTE